MLSEFISNVSANALGEIIGGFLIVFFLYILNRNLFRTKNIEGTWHFMTETEETTYNPNKGMLLYYTAVLWIEGYVVRGTTEKTHEISIEKKGSFSGKSRTRGTVEGNYKRVFFGKDRLFLHVVENGAREFTNSYDVRILSRKKMSGMFTSTAATQKGKTIWQRDSFQGISQ